MQKISTRYPNKVYVTVPMIRDELTRARELARQREQSLSALVRLAVRDHLEQAGGSQAK